MVNSNMSGSSLSSSIKLLDTTSATLKFSTICHKLLYGNAFQCELSGLRLNNPGRKTHLWLNLQTGTSVINFHPSKFIKRRRKYFNRIV